MSSKLIFGQKIIELNGHAMIWIHLLESAQFTVPNSLKASHKMPYPNENDEFAQSQMAKRQVCISLGVHDVFQEINRKKENEQIFEI